MPSVDKRVVEMKFDNAAFERGVAQTMDSLDRLKGKMDFSASAKGLEGIGSAANGINLSGIGAGVDALHGKFSALSIAGVTAIATITNKAVNAGAQLVKSFTIAPVLDGFHQYEQQINATQTVLANTAASGATLDSVTKTLATLNDYANLTIYNFSDMATNLGTFTSAGIKLQPASEAIQGLSNVAAAAGASTQSAAGAMYQISQALGRGKVNAQDWNSVVAAGMASSNFKGAILETAKAMGTIKMPKTESIAQWTKAGGSFQDAMSKGQITSGVLIQTLQAMTGNMTDAQLAQKGYTAEQIKSIQAMAQQAKAAAVNVKTFSALKDNLSQGVGSAYAQVFKTLIGDVPTATKFFTGLSEILNKIFVDPVNHLNDFLVKIKSMGALKNFAEGFKNIFTALGEVFHNVGHAFREIFPPSTGKDVLAISKVFRDFTQHLLLGNGTAGDLMKTFEGVFSILKIAISIVSGASKAFFGLFGVLGSGGQGGVTTLLKFTAIAGSFITNIQQWLTKTGAIKTFFAVFTSPLKLLKPTFDILMKLGSALTSLLTGDFSGFGSKLGDIGSLFKGMFAGILQNYHNFAQLLSDGFAKLEAFFTGFANRAKRSGNEVGAVFGTIAAKISGFLSEFTGNASVALGHFVGMLTGATSEGKNFLSGFGSGVISAVMSVVDKLSNAFQNLRDKMDFSPVLASFSTGIGTASAGASGSISAVATVLKAIGSIFFGIVHMFGNIGSFFAPIIVSIRDFFTTVMGKVTEGIKGMKGDDAIAAFNTGVLVVLFITIRRFLKSFGAIVINVRDTFKNISGAFSQLKDTLKSFQKDTKPDIILKIAIAVGILVGALYVLSKIDPGDLKKSLIAIGVLFAQLTTTILIIGKYGISDKGKVAQTGTLILLLAESIKILSKAVKILGDMNPKVLAQGLLAVGTLLAGLTLFLKFASVEKGGVKAGAGMILMAIAINILAGALRIIGGMDLGSIVKAALTIDFLLGSLVGAAIGMEGTLKGSAAMLVMATALAVLTPVLVLLGLLPYENLAKGLGTIAVSLLLMAVAANAMDSALPGAVAMVSVAKALLILAPALLLFGHMSWGSILKSMVTLAAALTILVIATNAMDTALPGAAALVIVALAIGMLVPVLIVLGNLKWSTILKGVGALALVLLVLIGAVYLLTPVIGIMILATKSIALLGAAVLLAGLGFLAFSAGLTALAATGAAGFAVLVAGVVSFLAILPLIARQVGYAFVTFAQVIGDAAPKLIEAFTKIVLAWLKSLQKTVPEFIRTMGIILKAMLDEIVKRGPQIYAAGLDLIIGFLEALKSRIGLITNLVIDIFTAFVEAVRKRLPNIIQAGIDFLVSFMNGLAEGIRKRSDEINAAGVNIATAIIDGIGKGLSKAGHFAREALEKLGQDLIDAFKRFFGINSPSTVFADMGLYLIQGLANGFSGAYHLVKKAVEDLGKKLPGWMQKVLGINSPSKVFHELGGFVGQGFANGIDASSSVVSKATTDMGTDAIHSVKKAITNIGKSISENMDTAPTIRPVLDLSHVEANAGKIGSMLNVGPIQSNAAYSKARDISSGYVANQAVALFNSSQATKALQTLAAAKSTQPESPRPVEFHIGTVQDGDTLLRRARATNKMLTLAEGGDSTQIMGLV